MKRIHNCLLVACLLVCMCLPTAALSLPGDEVQADVLARYTETFDENTAVAAEKDGSFTVTARDGANLTVSVKTGVLPEGARLMVIAVPEGEDAYRWFSSVLDKGRLQAYALYFIKDGERLDFEGELELSVTKPAKMANPLMYRVSPDGAVQELPFETQNELLHIITKYETPYIVIADAAGPSAIPKTGGSGFSGWLMAAGIASLTLVALRKQHTIRTKKENVKWN